MTSEPDNPKPAPRAGDPEPPPQERGAQDRVPEWAENMEHTLRRLAREKQRKRDKSPGLYR